MSKRADISPLDVDLDWFFGESAFDRKAGRCRFCGRDDHAFFLGIVSDYFC